MADADIKFLLWNDSIEHDWFLCVSTIANEAMEGRIEASDAFVIIDKYLGEKLTKRERRRLLALRRRVEGSKNP